MIRMEETPTGVVAIHRWFVEGEGWSYHPWFASRSHDLLAALKDELDTRRQLESAGGRRMISCHAFGGILVGEQCFDPDCPDPRASGRYPTILRVAFCPSQPSLKDQKVILSMLAGIDSQAPGVNQNLRINVHVTPPPPQSPSVQQRSPSQLRWLTFGVLILLIGGLGIFAWSHHQSKQHQDSHPSTDQKELELARSQMVALLQKWQGNVPDEKETLKVGQRFLQFLSQEAVKGKLTGSHPDILFVRRLPEHPRSPTNNKELIDDLNRLHKHLTEVKRPNEDHSTANGRFVTEQRTLSQVVEMIDIQMDYRRWWTLEGKNTRSYALGTEDVTHVSAYARRFIPKRQAVDEANRKWQQTAASKMVKTLREQWNVTAVENADVDARPWFVFHCYFQFLSQQHFSPDDLQGGSYPFEFVSRLPRESLSKDGGFLSENALKDSLRVLAKELFADKSDVTDTLLGNIATKMKYEQWKETVEIRGKREEGSPKINEYVQRCRIQRE